MNASTNYGALFLAAWLCLIAAGDGRTAEVGNYAPDGPLIHHVRYGNADKVAELLQKGTNPNATNSSGMTALQYAANNGHIEIIEMLLAKGAEVNTKDDTGRSPLIEAAGMNAETVKLLLEAGATHQPEALGFACWLNRTDVVALLLDVGISPDAGIVQAAAGNHLKLIRLLLDRGANVNARSQSGSTALHAVALSAGTELLLKEGADPHAQNDRGETPLHSAMRGHRAVDSIQLLLDAGSKMDVPNKEGVTPIRLAAIRMESEAYQLLLAASGGVEPRPDKEQMSAMDQPSKSTAELINDLRSETRETRLAAETALVARGRSIMPEVMQSIKSGEDIEWSFDLFVKMGPDAQAAVPKLISCLGKKKYVFGVVKILERMEPGSFDKLPKQSREIAAAALCDDAIDPDTDEMMGSIQLGYLYRFGEVATPHILKLLRSDNSKHRVVTARSVNFARFHDDTVERELVKIVRADVDLHARCRAARALGTMSVLSVEAADALLEVIRDQPPFDPHSKDADENNQRYFRERLLNAAAGSFGKAGPSRIDDLVPFLSPMDQPQRRLAIHALRYMGAPAVPRLIELMGHEDPAVAISPSVVLGKIRQPAVAALVKELTSRDEQVIDYATSALMRIGHGAKEAVPALLELAGSKHRSDIERLHSARAVLKIDRERVYRSKAIVSLIPMLIRTLEQGSFRHQYFAAKTLRRIGPGARQALPMLRKRLVLPGKDVDTDGLVRDCVQREAAEAIAAIEEEP